ncbi:unnamed protein product [Boreogadus saida]
MEAPLSPCSIELQPRQRTGAYQRKTAASALTAAQPPPWLWGSGGAARRLLPWILQQGCVSCAERSRRGEPLETGTIAAAPATLLPPTDRRQHLPPAQRGGG